MKVSFTIILTFLLLVGCSSTPTQENFIDDNNMDEEVNATNELDKGKFEEDDGYKEEDTPDVVTEDMLEEWHIEALDLLRSYEYTKVLILLNNYDDDITEDIELITRSTKDTDSESPNIDIIKNNLSRITNTYDVLTISYFLDKINTDLNNINSAISKSLGVIVGMTKEQVLNSSWGEPEKKNITNATYGTREQWVYGIGNYLYFDDDILTAISTSK